MDEKRLYLIDATAFCYRAFYALKGLSTSFGQPTNAVYGFLNMLNKIIKEKKPQYLAACFDVSRDTFRARKFAEYKIQRPPMPDGLSSQIPLIKEVISAYGISILEKQGFEADDIIATIAVKAKQAGIPVTIVSSDKDVLQLVDENTVVFNPYKEEGIILDIEGVRKEFGVSPGQVTDVIALMGDSVDNIPGVRGIGEKTATELIKGFGSVENLLDKAGEIKQEKIKQAVIAAADAIKFSKELAVLDRSVDIDFDAQRFMARAADTKELFRIFKQLEFKKLLKGLPVDDETKQPQAEVLLMPEEDLQGMLAAGDELFICGQPDEGLVFFAQGKFFRVGSLDGSIKGILSDPKIKKTGHDLKKIRVALAREGAMLKGMYFDTMIAGYLVNPSAAGYSLSDLALEYLDTSLSQEAVVAGCGLNLLLQLKPKLEEMLRQRSLEKLFYDLEMPLAEVLSQMELNGIKIDLDILKGLAKDLEKRLIQLIEEIYQASGTQFNINSPKQLSQVLFEKLKLPVIKRSKTGPSTDEEVLKRLAGSHQLPRLLLEYRQLMKLKTTYVDTLPQLADPQTNRIHTSFNQTATETGRLSSSNPNLQNLPVRTEIGSRIRQAIVASYNNSRLLVCDYSQIELRILAHLSGDDNLIAAFKNNRDIHKATAALIYGLDEKDITGQMRDTAKRVNFGIVYGLTSFGLSKDLSIPIDEAQVFIDAYFVRYPKVEGYIQQQIEKAKKDGFVSTLLGRRRYIPEINNKNQGIRQFAQRKAVNTPIQGTASDLIKLAMIEIHKEIESRKSGSKMVLQIHDELVFDVPQKEMDGFAALVKDRMENVLRLDVPIVVTVKTGKNWLEAEEY
ncbi:MAG: DNA polymerase I [Candidatus Omnitrophota bacterium]